jgi:hypothetical protein
LILNRELYREAYRSYQQWHEAESLAQARDAGQLSSHAGSLPSLIGGSGEAPL